MTKREFVSTETIQSLYTPNIVSVGSDTSISSVIDTMRQNNASCVLVLEERRPLGIFTEKNVVKIAARMNQGIFDFPVSSAMSTPVYTATEAMVMDDAFKVLSDNNVTHLVVVDDLGGVKGILSRSCLMRNLGLEYFLEFKRVGDVMNPDVMTAPLDMKLSKAIHRMTERALSCLVTVEEEQPLGIVTERDIARLVLEMSHESDPVLADVMTTPVLTVDILDSVYEASIRMQAEQVCRLVVVEHERELRGLLTLSDIIGGMERRYIREVRNALNYKGGRLRETICDSLQKQLLLDNILSSALNVGVIATDEALHVTYYNKSAEDILGFVPEHVIGCHIESIHAMLGIPAERIRAVIESIHFKARHAFSFEFKKNGIAARYIDATVSCIRDDDCIVYGYVLTIQDVTERHQSEQMIWKLAYHDPLTQLPNRLLISDRLGQALNAAERNNDYMALMMLDLDHFKYINDTLGHSAGDQLLISVARCLERPLRKSDTVARMGGDEFFVLLPKIASENDASLVAEKLLQSVRSPHRVGDHCINVTTSIGVALYPHDGTDAESLIKAADNALYKAKDLGRDVYTFL
ncbi:diguanylate cyclase domain-containing protein [Desulfovibrio inopinatus]|uniref:diguanylate cyclase domain-containing protein n=1 Tax=Desulfovibrio inopinatus TaxID=102109 RepID=UPI00040B1124|nr:diguanylate cyclase [Desulfovibrio inopinatus]